MLPIFLKIGPITLHTYGLMVALGFLAGYYLARRRFDASGLPAVYFDSLVFVVMLSGLLGARIFFFVSMDLTLLKYDPLSFFRFWEGGLVFYGGFIGAFIALGVYCRLKELSLLGVIDAFIPSLLIAQSLGRLGCFAAGCCYGRPTEGFFGVMFRNPDSLAPLGVWLHPTQLYSSAADMGLFFAALWLGRKVLRRGTMTAFYLLAYGALRFLIEFYRGDDRGPFLSNLSPGQWISLAAIVAGGTLLAYVQNRKTD